DTGIGFTFGGVINSATSPGATSNQAGFALLDTIGFRGWRIANSSSSPSSSVIPDLNLTGSESFTTDITAAANCDSSTGNLVMDNLLPVYWSTKTIQRSSNHSPATTGS